jgi:hypothetical protein
MARDYSKRRSVGRPRYTVDKLPENWEQIMMDAAQIGKGTVAWKVYLGISENAWVTLLEDSDEFASAVEKCMMLQQLWYEENGNRMIGGGTGNSNVFALMMANKFGWKSSKSEIVGNAAEPLSLISEVKNATLSKEDLIAEMKARGLPTTMLEFKDDLVSEQ